MADVAVHRFAAIAGRVTSRANDKSVPVEGASVNIVSAPHRFRARLKVGEQQFGSRWKGMTERPDRTITGADGHFHFMDLPNGDYEIRVTAPGAEQEVAVPVHIDRQHGQVKPPEKADVVLRFKQEVSPAPAQPTPQRPRLGRRRPEDRP